MKNYEIIEHTADIGIRVRGRDLPALFGNAALAMFDLIAAKKSESAAEKPLKFVIEQTAANREELFVNWLNELLSLSAAKEKIFCACQFKRIDEHSLEAEVSGCDILDYQLNTEIKAATYHQLKVEETKDGWQAEVIFDV